MNELKPYYRLSDFDDRKGRKESRNWTATCPKCGKTHLSISKNSGLFNCFTPGCSFSGMLEDYRPLDKQHNSLGELIVQPAKRTGIKEKRSSAVSQPPTLQTMQETADFLPEDYADLKPSVIKQLRPIADDKEVLAYLGRIGIPQQVAEQAGCMAATRTFNEKQCHCLAYVNRVMGKVINVKYRATDGKMFTQDAQESKDAPSAPYNIDCLNPLGNEDENEDEKTLVITEGEKDCLTLMAAGYKHVISIPNGAGNKPETCFAPFLHWLADVGRVVICGDEDRAGRVLKRNLKVFFEQMGIRVAIARMSVGCKDISDVNLAFGSDEVRRIIGAAEFPALPDIVRIGHRREQLKAVMRGEYDHGYSIGYGPVTDRHLWLTGEGGLMIVTGRPNSGKTDWLRCTSAMLMARTHRGCCFLSFEEPNKEKQVRRFVQIMMATCRTEFIPDDVQDRLLDFLDTRMVNMDMVSMDATPANILHVADQIRREGFAMSFLIIDPYLYVDMGSVRDNETRLIKDMLTTFQAWGRRNGIWVVMVAHPRMLQRNDSGEFEQITEYSIAGSAHWANTADFIISVKREFPFGKDCQTDADGQPVPLRSYTEVNVIKVRDQELCTPGKVFYLRQPNGRYDERPSAEACVSELEGAATGRHDREEWIK